MKKTVIIACAILSTVFAGCATYNIPVPTDAQIQAAFDQAVAAVEAYQAEHTNDVGAVNGAEEHPVTETPVVDIQTVGDEVKFADMNWTFGGFNGAKSILDAQVMIGKLQIAGSGMRYEFVNGSSLRGWDFERSWGMADGEASALACLFVKRTDGRWVGGKFDWISTSRKTRSFTNIFEGYHGWSLEGVPNPCKSAFVIVNPKAGVRTNIIKGDWKR